MTDLRTDVSLQDRPEVARPGGGARRGDTPTALLERVSVVLDVFEGGEAASGLTLADVVRRSELPRSSVHRMLEQLVRMRWMHRSGRRYRLGLRLLELGALAVNQDELHATALPVMYELHAATRLVVHLGMIEGPGGDDILYLDKIGGRLVQAVPTQVGGRRPAVGTALGAVLLAGRGDPRMDPAADARIVREGVARVASSAPHGYSCVAAPIGRIGEATAALSLCAPNRHARLDPRVISPLRIAAGTISRALGGVTAPNHARMSA
ncbi:IclR family transcriptional regulator domain-containing protein [Tomitella cavernea]|uniref:IclR family transcriptional regulator domain-containing protein n=1 Tax=Tomitella cavernea TaxID=1387982 RepID=UPI0019087CAC|nr:helix-turn-helix domain-containing protein [Tomitella cavernea]